MGLPDREAVLAELDEMIASWQERVTGSQAESTALIVGNPEVVHKSEPKPPALYSIGLVGHSELRSIDEDGTQRAMGEIVRRLDKLIRADDILGWSAPDRLLLATAALAPSAAGGIIERVNGAVALPVVVGGQFMSLCADIGLAFAFDGASSSTMLEAAEADMRRRAPG